MSALFEYLYSTDLEYYAKKKWWQIRKKGVKKVFKLIPIAISKTQRIKILNNLTKQDIEIGSKLINRPIKEKKISARVSLYYFNKRRFIL